jgi:anti-sigma factor ChrR (cupin superfamily)
MRARNILAFAVSFVLATAVLAQASGEAKAKSAPKAGPNAVIMPASDLKWTDLDPTGAPGVKIADVWGNHATGAFGAFTKFPAGFTAPLHTHTNSLKIVVISGTFILTPEGKPEDGEGARDVGNVEQARARPGARLSATTRTRGSRASGSARSRRS